MTFSTRLTELMTEKKASMGDVSKATGVTRSAVKYWVDGKVVQLKYEDANKLADFFGVNVDWLMKGVGDKTSNPDAIILKKVNVQALCGKPDNCLDPRNDDELVEMIKAGSKWFFTNFPHYKPEDIQIVTATGDSMEPIISEGDLVFIDIKDQSCNRDGIYFLFLDGQYFIKRVQRSFGQRLILISENQKYRDIELSPDAQIEFHTIGRVIKSFKSMNY